MPGEPADPIVKQPSSARKRLGSAKRTVSKPIQQPAPVAAAPSVSPVKVAVGKKSATGTKGPLANSKPAENASAGGAPALAGLKPTTARAAAAAGGGSAASHGVGKGAAVANFNEFMSASDVGDIHSTFARLLGAVGVEPPGKTPGSHSLDVFRALAGASARLPRACGRV